jgi:hypothetical protein
MALEVMQAEMLQQLRNRGADARRLDEYIEVWTDAFDRIGERLPCPSCFADYGTGRLTRRPTQDRVGRAGCEHCYTLFTFPDPG